jgi:polyisoprenoid-binding protein YceI
MKKKSYVLMLLALFSLLALSACGVFQEVEAPSATLEAIPLETQAAGVATAEPAEPTAAPEEPTAAPEEPTTAPEATEATEPTAAPPTETPTEAPTETPASTALVFTIDPAASQVRFEIDEDLRGQRNTVVGTTDQVAGQLSVNLADLAQTEVGIIQINARTLATDNDFRNRAINNEILDTGQFEFITFTPTAIEGLPASATIGEPVSFTLVGDLTIRDVTLPATFTVEATPVSETQITGTATAVVNRTDFGLQIPSVPNVANVEEEVELYIDFTANAS